MLKIKQILITAFILAGITSCANNTKNAGNIPLSELKTYVDSVNSANLVYSNENWAAIDNGYNERAMKAEAEAAKLNEEEKAELAATKTSYVALKVKYQAELAKNNVTDPKVILRNSLFGEGKVGDDMKFEFANAQNLLSIYQYFVDQVDLNRNKYSREDWDEIKTLYEALDTRKNAVERDLDGSDNRQIAALKIKYARIYTGNRPTSKARENSEAKE